MKNIKIWRDLPLRLSQISHSDACSCSAHFPLSGGRGPPEKSAERPCRIFRFPDIYHKTEQNSRRGRELKGRFRPVDAGYHDDRTPFFWPQSVNHPLTPSFRLLQKTETQSFRYRLTINKEDSHQRTKDVNGSRLLFCRV